MHINKKHSQCMTSQEKKVDIDETSDVDETKKGEESIKSWLPRNLRTTTGALFVSANHFLARSATCHKTKTHAN